MNKRVIGVVITIALIMAFLFCYIISYANTGETIYVNLAKANSEQIGYGIGNPNNAGTGKYIWEIVTHQNSNKESAQTVPQRNLYCVKAEYGESWNGESKSEETIVEYNLKYDLQTQREEILRKLETDEKDIDEIIKKLLNPEENQYKQILWLLDNMYIPGKTDKMQFLARIGITEQEGVYEWDDPNGSDKFEEYETLITDDDIIAVQKAVIWYFTNTTGLQTSSDETYNKRGKEDWLNITTDGGNTYKALADLEKSDTDAGPDRNAQAQHLYEQLISDAIKYASQYTAENGYKVTKSPITLDSKDLQQDDGKYILGAKKNDSGNYIVGPIKLKQEGGSTYSSIELIVTDQAGTTVDSSKYTFTNSEGVSLNKTDIKDLINNEGGFYITVNDDTITKVNVKITVKYEVTKKTLWLTGTETSDKITLNKEQPLVEVKREDESEEIELFANLEEFDLALRKYIIEINGQQLATDKTRVPNISEDTLQTGTTATYRHPKNPIEVKENDIVTYAITIYNEGNKAGYASQIVDQLPDGLIYSTDSEGETSTVTSVDKSGANKNTYKVTYSPTLNTVTFDIENNAPEHTAKSLNAYSKESGLDYETIKLKCKVVLKPDEKEEKVLTNVAWISKAYDSVAGKEIGTKGEDRDSEPQTKPNVSKGTMEDYKGDKKNKDDLTDSNNYYKGEQDDDDFEKLVVKPVKKKFDLALFKHIAAISKDETIEDGEYVTDTKKKDGKYLRAPVVKSIENGKVIYEEDSKEALVVEPGDYVLYTIRVYNEGEIDGYASEIKDTLPIGLEFVVGNVEYNGIWKLEGLDSDGRQVVTTTWFAKGNGEELNTRPEDEKYTANLLKALRPDDDVSDENPDYLDAQVLCRVVEKATSSRVLVNYAQISDDSDKDGNEVEDEDSTPDEWIEGDDDQDIERVKLQYFDLSLRKFITAINDEELKNADGKYTREPKVDVSPLVNGTDSTAIYEHSKKPLAVQVGDRVVYTIRAYNEGTIAGYASEITDYLPPYLTFAEDSEINDEYGWEVSEDGRVVKTDYLKTKELSEFNGEELYYEDVKIECIVSSTAPTNENMTNIAEITEYTYNGKTVPEDIDSKSDSMKEDLPEDEDLPDYKKEQENNPYVPGNEDDDDFEKVYVKKFDLSLRKFITQIQDQNVTTREPQVDTSALTNGTNTTAQYTHPKDPLLVHVGDTVIYTIRIYNEGEIDGYASEITDDIPEYLEYLPENETNIEYKWEMYDKDGNKTTNVSEAVKVKTNYLSKENGEQNLLKAFDGTTLDFKDLKIAFKVKDPNSNTTIITNHAQISEDTDKNGNEVEDYDSKTDEWNEGEDDQDVEHVKVEYFDLALLKYVTKVIVVEDGVEKITETGYNGLEDPEPVVKVELHRKKLSQVVVKFGYGIRVTNEGDIPGYVKEITDYIPEGLKFEAADNPLWTDEGNNVISTRQLEGTLLQPGESATVEVILTWINGADNLALKTNVAEISEDDNEHKIPDRDSTPDNKKEGEDDIDEAKVILSIGTGAIKTYFTLTLGLLTVVLVGIILIKKFVI